MMMMMMKRVMMMIIMVMTILIMIMSILSYSYSMAKRDCGKYPFIGQRALPQLDFISEMFQICQTFWILQIFQKPGKSGNSEKSGNLEILESMEIRRKS